MLLLKIMCIIYWLQENVGIHVSVIFRKRILGEGEKISEDPLLRTGVLSIMHNLISISFQLQDCENKATKQQIYICL